MSDDLSLLFLVIAHRDSFRVRDGYPLSNFEPGGEGIANRVAQINEERGELIAEEAHVKAAAEAFAKELASAHVPVRDIGTLLPTRVGKSSDTD